MKLNSKPWITKGLLKSITTKNKLFQRCYKHQETDLVTTYKTYFSKLTKLKKLQKERKTETSCIYIEKTYISNGRSIMNLYVTHEFSIITYHSLQMNRNAELLMKLEYPIY